MRKLLVVAAFIIIIFNVYTEPKLKPVFDADECAKMLQIAAYSADTPWVASNIELPYPTGYNMVYRSETVGLDNRWTMWMRDDSVAVISIRGTVLTPASSAADFYSAMMPATGSMNIGGGKIFTYELASDNNAYVHTGFVTALGYLTDDIVSKINECYAKGIREFIIAGHSQGGALVTLLTSYLYYLAPGIVPQDIVYKTYATAPPKMGNLFYAYDYEFIRRGGWAYRVISPLDWVPNMPGTVQTKFDYNENNPIPVIDSALAEKLNIIERIIAGLAEESLLGSLDNARDNLIKYFGNEVYNLVAQHLKNYPKPEFSSTFYYMPAGSSVILKPTEDYMKKFIPDGGFKGIFRHHWADAYYFLLDKWYNVSGK